MGQVLAVISGKGGTGKTSMCAGVAGCLCMEGARVLCIDADLGLRNLDISLGMSSEAVLPFTAVMRGEYSLSQAAESAGATPCPSLPITKTSSPRSSSARRETAPSRSSAA